MLVPVINLLCSSFPEPRQANLMGEESKRGEDGPSRAHPLLAAFYCAINIVVAGEEGRVEAAPTTVQKDPQVPHKRPLPCVVCTALRSVHRVCQQGRAVILQLQVRRGVDMGSHGAGTGVAVCALQLRAQQLLHSRATLPLEEQRQAVAVACIGT